MHKKIFMIDFLYTKDHFKYAAVKMNNLLDQA